MSDFGSSKGKAADTGTSITNGGFQSTAPMRVERPKPEDLQRSYASVVEEVHFPGWYGTFIHGLGECIGALGAVPCCICCPNPFKRVNQGNVGLVTKFGRFYKAVDPGLVKINPLSENLTQVDVKIQIVEVRFPVPHCTAASVHQDGTANPNPTLTGPEASMHDQGQCQSPAHE